MPSSGRAPKKWQASTVLSLGVLSPVCVLMEVLVLNSLVTHSMLGGCGCTAPPPRAPGRSDYVAQGPADVPHDSRVCVWGRPGHTVLD